MLNQDNNSLTEGIKIACKQSIPNNKLKQIQELEQNPNIEQQKLDILLNGRFDVRGALLHSMERIAVLESQTEFLSTTLFKFSELCNWMVTKLDQKDVRAYLEETVLGAEMKVKAQKLLNRNNQTTN